MLEELKYFLFIYLNDERDGMYMCWYSYSAFTTDHLMDFDEIGFWWNLVE